jgi:hypothetical protein
VGATAGGGVYSKQFSAKQFSVSFHEVLHRARRGRVSKFTKRDS